MKKFTWVDGIAFIIWALPIVYVAAVYSTLPTTLPVHFGTNGKPDRYGSPAEFLTGLSIISVVSIGVYFLMKFLPAIDPKKAAQLSQATFNKIAVVMVIFYRSLIVLLFMQPPIMDLILRNYYFQ